MPFVPPSEVFIAMNLTGHALAFVCNEPGTTLMIYLPNTPFSYPSGATTTKMEYKAHETHGMIANGALAASQNKDDKWPVCLGCLLREKMAETSLPKLCEECFKKNCYKQEDK
jgi:lysophospholipase